MSINVTQEKKLSRLFPETQEVEDAREPIQDKHYCLINIIAETWNDVFDLTKLIIGMQSLHIAI